MLNTLRNSSKNSILKIILGTLLTILIISFAMWGTEDLVGVNKKQTTVATVGNLDISSREFYSLYSRQTEEIRKLLENPNRNESQPLQYNINILLKEEFLALFFNKYDA